MRIRMNGILRMKSAFAGVRMRSARRHGLAVESVRPGFVGIGGWYPLRSRLVVAG